MESGPLSTPEFKTFAKDVVLFVHITTWIPDTKYDDLLTKKGGKLFPYLIVMDAAGKKLGKVAGRDATSFAATIQNAKTYVRLEAKADLTQAEEVELLAANGELGNVDFKQALAKRDALGELSAEAKALLNPIFVDLQIIHTVDSVGDNPSEQKVSDMGKGFYAQHKAGVAPRSDEAYQSFYGVMMQYGRIAPDVGAFEVALKAMKARFSDLPYMQAYFEELGRVLEQLRAREGK